MEMILRRDIRGPKIDILHQKHAKHWQIKKEGEFQVWVFQLNTFSHFFLWSFKTKLGVSGLRGIPNDPRGNQVLKYSWRLGKESNNEAEAYSFLQRIKIASSMSTRSLLFFGDSSIIIQHLVNNSLPKESSIAQIVKRIKK